MPIVDHKGGKSIIERLQTALYDEPIRFLPLAEVKSRVSLSRAEIYRRMKAKALPRTIRLRPARVAWVESEVVAWQENLVRGCPRRAVTRRPDANPLRERRDRNTVSMVAEHWSVSADTVRRQIKAGALPCLRIGVVARITRE